MTRATALERADVMRVVTEAVTEVFPDLSPGDVDGSAHLKDLGADSVERVEIILAVLDRLGLDEPLSSFSALPDIDSMVDLLHDLLHERSLR